MNKRIIITGATGLIGWKLVSALLSRNYNITILTRNLKSAKEKLKNYKIEFVEWDYSDSEDEIVKYINGSFSVINLAGASLGSKRWNDEFKKIIKESRVLTTGKIVNAISKCEKKPESLINASAIGFYGTNGDEDTFEDSNKGNDFLADVCFEWEQEAYKAEQYGVRTSAIRTGIVLDNNEGALAELIKPFKFFAGNYQGSGKQWVSWIHIDDLINLYIYAIESINIKGGVNATAPNPVRNKFYCTAIGKAMHRPAIFKVPDFILKIILGEFANYVITGKKVLPKKAQDNGFKFKFNEIEKALFNILG